MSKERARRREVREREAAVRTAARAREAERQERRTSRRRAVTAHLPRRHSRPTGVLAARRRRRTGVTLAILVALNVLLWLIVDDGGIRAMVLLVSPLAAPVLHTLLFRR